MNEVFTNSGIFKGKTLKKAHEAVAASTLANSDFAWCMRPNDKTKTQKRTTVGMIRDKLVQDWGDWT
jgi:hypothetical protein